MNKRQIKNMRRQFTLKERFRYWFDNLMAKGSLGFIRILIIASVLLGQHFHRDQRLDALV